MGNLAAVEDRTSYPGALLQALIKAEADLGALDARLFSAILGCISGARRGALEERLRAQAPFAAGALALRCLDDWFREGAERRARAATKELTALQPHGSSADAFDKLLSRYRFLAQQAGAGVGAFPRLEVLRRAADLHPKLGMVWAAWKQSDGGDADNLLRLSLIHI